MQKKTFSKAVDGWRLRAVGKWLIPIILVQFLFWAVFKPIFLNSNIQGFDRIKTSNFAVATLTSPELTSADATRFEPVEKMPHWECCDGGYRAFRYDLELEAVPPLGLGYVPKAPSDNFAVYINGAFAIGEGRMELPDITYHGNLRRVYHVTPAMLKEGKNEFVVVMVRNGSPYFDYYAPLIGEYRQMIEATRLRAFMMGPYRTIGVIISFLLAVFAAIVFMRARDKALPFWVCAITLVWAVHAGFYHYVDPPFRGEFRLSAYFLTGLFIPFAWFGLVDAWSRRRLPYAIAGACTVYGIAAGGIIYALYAMPPGTGFDLAGSILNGVGIAFAALTAVRIIWGMSKGAETRNWEFAIILLLLLLIIMQLATDWLTQLNVGYLSTTQPILLLAFIIAFFTRNVRLFQSSAQIQEQLEAELDVRTKELREAHIREQGFVRKQAHDEERKRILRDMHDGLGSTLMSMLLAARRGKIEGPALTEGLQTVIDEMRLIIESMDSVGESLIGALATFRERTEKRVEQAGKIFLWRDDLSTKLPTMGPRDVLQVFRILQEAVNNALKHSTGDTISVEITTDENQQTVIHVHDNGSTYLPNDNGHGLKNMRNRADRIGGHLSIVPEQDGLSVTLAIPSEAA